MAAVIDQWEKLHLAGKRPNYATAATATLRRVFAKYLDVPVGSLDRTVVVRVLDGLAKEGKAPMAGATARYGSALFGWAVKRGALASNPFERVPVVPTVRRDRVLSDDEVRRVWRATEGPGSFNAIARALLLTGQRREKVSGLTWGELDLALSVSDLCPPPDRRTASRTSSRYRRKCRLCCVRSVASREPICLPRGSARLFGLEQVEGSRRSSKRRARLDASRFRGERLRRG